MEARTRKRSAASDKEVKTMPRREPIFISVFYQRFQRTPDRTHNYSFVTIRGKLPRFREKRDAQRIKFVRAPRQFQDLLGKLPGTNGIVVLGQIGYSARGTKAKSKTYEPKRHLNSAGVKTRGTGLGYYLSTLAERHLQTQGITHLSTGPTPSRERISQLAKVGLKPKTDYPIQQWIKAMEKGVRMQKAGRRN